MMSTDALTHALLNSFQQHAQHLNGKRVWLACSGGRDSLSLAMVCRQLFDKGELPFLPQLLHVNHGMQEANADWSKQVTAWAEQANMPCTVLSLQLTEKTEQAARQARYAAMMSVMNSNDVLILGHHQDDQVETVLMRLFSGAGVNGLSGMQEWRYKSATVDTANDAKSEFENTQCRGIYLWRPWLSMSRAQITEYAKAQQLEFIDDPTNIIGDSSSNSLSNNVESTSHDGNDRAWLRSVLLPHIVQRYPKAKSAIARTSYLMQDAAAIIDEQTLTDIAEICIEDTAWQSIIDINKLHALSMPRQSALIHAWLSPSDKELPPSKRLVDEVIELAKRQDSDHQTSLYWDSGQHQYYIRCYKNQLYRLHHDWLNWLEIPVDSQRIDLNASKHVDVLELKSNEPEPVFEWQMQGVSALISALLTPVSVSELNDSKPHDLTLCKESALIIEPLPRNLKLSLVGRVGRKSGKKLLQALNQPSFMRQSVGLCSLITPSQKSPLAVITTQRIHLLDSPYTDNIRSLIEQNKLLTHISSQCKTN